MKSLHNASLALGKLLLRPLGKRSVEKLISFLATAADIDLLAFAYDYSGVAGPTATSNPPANAM